MRTIVRIAAGDGTRIVALQGHASGTAEEIIRPSTIAQRWIRWRRRPMAQSTSNDLASISLAFCREIMGWSDAHHCGDGYIVSASKNFVWEPQHSHNLSRVARDVTEWCGTNGAAFLLKWRSLDGVDGRYSACVQVNSTDEVRVCLNDNPSAALMSARVEAARLLKSGGNHDRSLAPKTGIME